MIVPMKKIFLVAQDKDVLPVMDRLRQIGTVHVEHEKTPVGHDVEELNEEVAALERVITVLSQEPRHAERLEVEDWQDKVRIIFGLMGLIEQYREGVTKRQVLINQWEPWGNFDPEEIEDLAEKGIFIRFVELPEKDLDQGLPDGVALHLVFKQEGIARCLAISRENIKLSCNVLPLPPVSLVELKRVQERNSNRIHKAQDKITENAKYLDSFKEILLRLQEELAFQEVYAGRGAEEKLALIKGFCPQDGCAELERAAQKEQWGLIIEDPAQDEPVPTLLRNPRWVNLIKPVFDFINITPGYKEVDISLFFLLFFAIFVAMLIGDAGYGLLFIILNLIFHLTLGRKVPNKTLFYLVYILSVMTVAWGVLTGTFFGQQWIPQGTIKPLLPWLRDNNNVQMFCFILGAAHLSIAHIWRVILKLTSLALLAELGWLSLVWGMFFAAMTLILGAAFPVYAKYLFIVGPILVIFFSAPNKNILKAIGPGLGDFLLNVINTFTDIVSYIRLFAVGLATVAVADAANTMALEVGFGSFGTGVISILILFVGHVINIILAVMAILVHGLRLNVLEFSGHLNMEWAGFAYNPFRKIKKA